MRPSVVPVTTLTMPTSLCGRSLNVSSSQGGMGRENIVPSGKMGLGQPPEPESMPRKLRINFSASQLLIRDSAAHSGNGDALRHREMGCPAGGQHLCGCGIRGWCGCFRQLPRWALCCFGWWFLSGGAISGLTTAKRAIPQRRAPAKRCSGLRTRCSPAGVPTLGA